LGQNNYLGGGGRKKKGGGRQERGGKWLRQMGFCVGKKKEKKTAKARGPTNPNTQQKKRPKGEVVKGIVTRGRKVLTVGHGSGNPKKKKWGRLSRRGRRSQGGGKFRNKEVGLRPFSDGFARQARKRTSSEVGSGGGGRGKKRN